MIIFLNKKYNKLLLEITNINYTIDIPQIHLFSEPNSNITSNIILERTEDLTIKLTIQNILTLLKNVN